MPGLFSTKYAPHPSLFLFLGSVSNGIYMGMNPYIQKAKAYFQLPLFDLIFEAHKVHRANHDPSEIQKCTLLSIKTGGCAENCSYCPQSAHYDTGLERQKLMEVGQVALAAKNAKAN